MTEQGPSAVEQGAGERSTEPTRILITRRRVLASAVFVLVAIGLMYFVLPKLVGLRQTWDRIQHGDPWWFGLGAVLEVCSFLGYVVLFRAVFARGQSRIDWRESYQITMAGLAATRLLASAGAGGIALTAWAVRRSGMEPRVVACRLIAFMALLYGVYMAALVVCGLGLYLGPIPGDAPFGITVVPAIFGALVIAVFLGIALVPSDSERRLRRWSGASGRMGRVARWLAAAPATMGSGVRTALALIRSRDPQLLGAVAWWGFDIAVLWACFHAFGSAPPKGEIVMAYFVGMLGNTLPLPGGIGGVDGGMIGAFTAFGTPVQVTIVSVLAYRVFAFWLPTVPGAIAYFQLRRTVARWRVRTADAVSEPSYTL
jgi:putative heme transporter